MRDILDDVARHGARSLSLSKLLQVFAHHIVCVWCVCDFFLWFIFFVVVVDRGKWLSVFGFGV